MSFNKVIYLDTINNLRKIVLNDPQLEQYHNNELYYLCNDKGFVELNELIIKEKFNDIKKIINSLNKFFIEKSMNDCIKSMNDCIKSLNELNINNKNVLNEDLIKHKKILDFLINNIYRPRDFIYCLGYIINIQDIDKKNIQDILKELEDKKFLSPGNYNNILNLLNSSKELRLIKELKELIRINHIDGLQYDYIDISPNLFTHSSLIYEIFSDFSNYDENNLREILKIYNIKNGNIPLFCLPIEMINRNLISFGNYDFFLNENFKRYFGKYSNIILKAQKDLK